MLSGSFKLVTLRPRQWIKNALVVAAAGAAGALGHDDVPVRVGLACIAFCLLASGIYAVNDVRDVHEDRWHPRKRDRPVAAGELDPRAALVLGAVTMLAGLALCVFVRPLLAVVGAGYLALTLSYTLIWRHILILDVVVIAGGLVLRAVADGVAAPVTLSLVGSCSWSRSPPCSWRPASARRSCNGPTARKEERGGCWSPTARPGCV